VKRLFIIILCVVCTKAHATTPLAPKIFENDSWTFVAGFAWPDENDKVLIIRTVRKTTLLSLDELVITPLEELEEWTTAGSAWYQNSIGYVTSVKVKGTDSESDLRVFYFRNRNGKESVVNLKTSKLIEPSTILNKAGLDKKTVSNAILLLKSDRAHDRQTAAIHLGQLGASEHLQRLIKLLGDKAAYTQISGKEEKTVHYVKEAAEKAIQSIKSKMTANKAIDSDKK
jgi:hypothetical protein